MTKEFMIKKLIELKEANLPHVTYDDIKDSLEYRKIYLNNDEIDAVNKYFNKFVKLEKWHECIFCGHADYSWGLVHGSANCNHCGSDYKLIHYLDFLKDHHDLRLNIALQYHPDRYEID